MNQPIILREKKYKNDDLERFKKNNKIWKIVDVYETQIKELHEILFPYLKSNSNKLTQLITNRVGANQNLKGSWVYFPWNGSLVHMLNERDYYTLRTNRNRDLITLKEQDKLKKFTVGIAGLSIGSNIALSLVQLGINNFKISDFDDLATTNLNRVPFGLPEISLNKAELTAQKLYEINPFIDLQIFETGLSKRNLENFLAGKKKLNIVVDAIDDFEMKVLMRLSARKHRIPILMFTNLGDSCLIDIERCDKEKGLKVFNNLLGDLPERILKTKMTEKDKQKFAAKLVGINNIPTKALDSLLKIGKILVGRPQLSSTVSVSSGFAGLVIKKIALNETCPSGRQLVHFDTAIFSEKNTAELYSKEPGRKEIISKLTK